VARLFADRCAQVASEVRVLVARHSVSRRSRRRSRSRSCWSLKSNTASDLRCRPTLGCVWGVCGSSRLAGCPGSPLRRVGASRSEAWRRSVVACGPSGSGCARRVLRAGGAGFPFRSPPGRVRVVEAALEIPDLVRRRSPIRSARRSDLSGFRNPRVIVPAGSRQWGAFRFEVGVLGPRHDPGDRTRPSAQSDPQRDSGTGMAGRLQRFQVLARIGETDASPGAGRAPGAAEIERPDASRAGPSRDPRVARTRNSSSKTQKSAWKISSD
jgi:hypothetical protein